MIFSFVWKFLKNNFTIIELILIIALLIQSILICSFFIWRNISYRSYHYPLSSIKPEYEILKKEVYYTVKKESHSEVDENGNAREIVDYKLDFSNYQTIKCCIQRLERIPCKFLWTGKSKANLPISTSEQEVRAETEKKGVWCFYDIVLEKHLFKGDTTQIKNKYPLISDCKSSSPFVSSATDNPTKSLIFHLDLGVEYAHKKVTFETFRSNESSYPLSCKETLLDDEGKLTYIVKKPKRFRSYILRWNWN